jgi:hypothetical protein
MASVLTQGTDLLSAQDRWCLPAATGVCMVYQAPGHHYDALCRVLSRGAAVCATAVDPCGATVTAAVGPADHGPQLQHTLPHPATGSAPNA